MFCGHIQSECTCHPVVNRNDYLEIPGESVANDDAGKWPHIDASGAHVWHPKRMTKTGLPEDPAQFGEYQPTMIGDEYEAPPQGEPEAKRLRQQKSKLAEDVEQEMIDENLRHLGLIDNGGLPLPSMLDSVREDEPAEAPWRLPTM